MKLYYSPSACSLAPHIVLHELGTPHTSEKVDLANKKTASGGDFTAINPKGYVPTVELNDGQVLTEVSTILQYLADQSGSDSLLPKAGTMARYRAMEKLNFIASELHKGLGGLFLKGMPEEGRKLMIEKLEKRLDWADAEIGRDGYISGKSFSVADAYAFTVLSWGKWVGVDMSKWTNIANYLIRIGARPAVQAAQQAEAQAAAA